MTHKEQLAFLLAKINHLESALKVGSWEYYLSEGDSTLYCSPQMFKILNRALDKGHPKLTEFYSHIHPHDQIHWDLMINKASIEGTKSEAEVRIFDNEEQMMWVTISVEGVVKDHKVVAIHGVCQDITELKNLRAHFEQTQSIIDELA